jgi:type VI secretion system Hcp family effector
MTRRVRTGALLVAGALGAGTAIAIASVPDSNGIVHACVQTDAASGLPAPSTNVRVIDSASQACTGGEKAVTLGGQPGPQGVQGPPGPSGTVTATEPPPETNSGQVAINGGRAARALPISGATTFPFISISLGVTGPGNRSAGYGTARIPAPTVVITRDNDEFSAKIMLACASGEHFKTVVFQLFKSGTKTPYLTYTLTNAFITSVQTSGQGDALPKQTVQFAEEKLTTQYSPGAAHTLPAIQYSSNAKTKLKFPSG